MSNKLSSIKVESPLQYFHRRTSHQSQVAAVNGTELFNGDAEFALVVKEAPICTHLNLRGDGRDDGFSAGVSEVLGIPLPTEPGHYHCNHEHSLHWLGPDEWMLVSQAGALTLEAALRQRLTGHISIVDLSGGQALINMRGSNTAVQTMLKKSSVYDFAGWPSAQTDKGCCVQTTFAKATAVVSNKSDGSFDLIIRRSFADYIARWLLDAGQEFGCRIEG